MFFTTMTDNKLKVTKYIMTQYATPASVPDKTTFTPKMENFKTSLMYEGLALKSDSDNRSIEELKRDYAR